MDAEIIVETMFDDGKIWRRKIGRLHRAPDLLEAENLGLLIDEAKLLLRNLQETLLQDQIREATEFRRQCDGCGKRRVILDKRGRTFATLFGRFRMKSPRLRQCRCRKAQGVTNPGAQSLLAELFPDRATPELRRLQAELRLRHSFRESARISEYP